MNNEEKNTYVKKQIVEAFIKLLKEKDFNKITILEITQTAMVSRNSFYRNYSDKEDILKKHVKYLLETWKHDYELENNDSNAQMYGSLFKHLYDYKDFYLLLKEKNLFHLFLNAFLEIFGSNQELDNISAYSISFITYGTYGWIEEWIARGMQESAETITELLLNSGMK